MASIDWRRDGVLLLTHGVLLSESVLMFEGVVRELRAVVCRSVTVITAPIKSDCAVTCLITGRSLRVHAVGQVGRAAEHAAGGLMVVRSSHRGGLTGRRGPSKRCSVPACSCPSELSREVHGEGAQAAVRVSVMVVGVSGGAPARFLFDEGMWSQRAVRCTQGRVR